MNVVHSGQIICSSPRLLVLVLHLANQLYLLLTLLLLSSTLPLGAFRACTRVSRSRLKSMKSK